MLARALLGARAGPVRPLVHAARAASSTPPASLREAKKYEPPPLVDLSIEADPKLTEKDIHANPNKLLPERQELIWDDGTARTEWYIDRECWTVTNGQAASRLLGAIFLGLGGFAYFMKYNYTNIGYGAAWVPREMPFDNAAIAYGRASASDDDDE